MIRGFAIAGFLVVIAMIGIGYVMSRRSQEKLEVIEQVLERVADGDASARIGIAHPSDQIDRISQKIDAQLAKLDAVMQGTRRASASVAHDLRKPLARVSMILERGLARAEAGEDVRAEFEDGLAGLEKLNAIVATILRIARIEGHDIGDFQLFDLRAVLDEVAETYEAVAEDAGMKLLYERPADKVELVGDANMIAQLVINLLQNAITHAGDGAKIFLGAERRNQAVLLTVSDTGQGIPEDLRERVFEPMYRADAARTKDGNGLGLALVKAIADRHSADIVLSDAKPGLRVVTAFPTS
jgi:signal transduction histidine kinase